VTVHPAIGALLVIVAPAVITAIVTVPPGATSVVVVRVFAAASEGAPIGFKPGSEEASKPSAPEDDMLPVPVALDEMALMLVVGRVAPAGVTTVVVVVPVEPEVAPVAPARFASVGVKTVAPDPPEGLIVARLGALAPWVSVCTLGAGTAALALAGAFALLLADTVGDMNEPAV
jgi:hypothetical protein